MQKESLKQLAKKKHHHLITGDIIKALINVSKKEIIDSNLIKSYQNTGMIVE